MKSGDHGGHKTGPLVLSIDLGSVSSEFALRYGYNEQEFRNA